MGMSAVGDTLLAIIADEMIRAWAAIRRALGDSLGFSSANHIDFDRARLVTGNPRVQGLMDADRVQSIVAQMPPDQRRVLEAHYLSGKRKPWRNMEIGRSAYFERLKAARAFLREHLDKPD